MELDRVPLWRGNHVSISQLAEDFPKYIYLPRLKDSSVLLASIRDGAGLLTWEHDSFATADSYDEVACRYRGLRGGKLSNITDTDSSALLVKPSIALEQLAQETKDLDKGDDKTKPDDQVISVRDDDSDPESDRGGSTTVTKPQPRPKRFHGTVQLNALRVGADAGKIAEEVIAHLSGLVGAKVKVTLEVEAEIPSGTPENVVRTVTENSRTLKFLSQGFELE